MENNTPKGILPTVKLHSKFTISLKTWKNTLLGHAIDYYANSKHIFLHFSFPHLQKRKFWGIIHLPLTAQF